MSWFLFNWSNACLEWCYPSHTHEIDQKFSIAQTIGSMHWELKSIRSDFGMLELIRKSCYGVANIREGVSECIKCRVEAVRQWLSDRNETNQIDPKKSPAHQHYIRCLQLQHQLHEAPIQQPQKFNQTPLFSKFWSQATSLPDAGKKCHKLIIKFRTWNESLTAGCKNEIPAS